MINFYNQVPSVYTSASRDFQYLSWLINIVLNSVKHNVDDIYDLPMSKADPRLTELLALTLGFKVRRKYDQDQLAALVSILPSLLKYKGTKYAVVLAIQALIKSSGVIGDFDASLPQFFNVTKSHIDITLPKDLIDITLFTDLLPYILPAGMTYRINRKTQKVLYPETDLAFDGEVRAASHWYSDYDSALNIAVKSPSLSVLFNSGNSTPEFTNFKTDKHEQQFILNTGLLDNSLIPAVDVQINNPATADYTVTQNEYGSTVILNRYSTIDTESGQTAVIGEE